MPEPQAAQPEAWPGVSTPADAPPAATHEVRQEAPPNAGLHAASAALESPSESVLLGSRANCLVPGGDGPTLPERVLEAKWRIISEHRIDDVHALDPIVLVETEDHGLRALDAATGEQRWEQRRFSKDADVLAVDGQMLVRDPDDWSIYALAPTTGKRRWKRNLGGAPLDLLACHNHRAVVATHRGHVDGGRDQTLYASAFDSVEGGHLWSVPVPGAQVAITGDSIFVQRMGPITDAMMRVDCATSAVSPVLWMKDIELLRSSDDRNGVLIGAARFEAVSLGSKAEDLVCLVPPGSDAARCFDPTEGFGGGAGRHVLVKDDIVYYSVRRALEGGQSWVDRIVAWKPGEGKLWEMPSDSNLPILDGGSTVVVVANQRILFLDPLAAKVVACLPTSELHAPTVVIDGDQLVLWTNGRDTDFRSTQPPSVVAAVSLPSPGPPARSPIPVHAIAGAGMPLATSEGGIRLRELSSFRAHPKRGMSSGMMMDGTVEDLAFLDAEHIVVGGNDNHLAVYEFMSGKQVSRTDGGAKDLRVVEPCGTSRIAAATLVPEVLLFDRKTRGHRLARKLEGSFVGWLQGCEHLLVSRDRTVAVVEAGSGRERANISTNHDAWDDLRARDGRVIVRRGSDFELVEALADGVRSIQAITVPPTDAQGGVLTQVELVGDDTMVREYCSQARCSVELASLAGEVKETWTFDVLGGRLVAKSSSWIDLSPGGRFVLFRRKYLLPSFVDRTTQTRGLIANGSGPGSSGYVSVAFSDDESMLALGGHPRPYDVTVLELPR